MRMATNYTNKLKKSRDFSECKFESRMALSVPVVSQLISQGGLDPKETDKICPDQGPRRHIVRKGNSIGAPPAPPRDKLKGQRLWIIDINVKSGVYFLEGNFIDVELGRADAAYVLKHKSG